MLVDAMTEYLNHIQVKTDRPTPSPSSTLTNPEQIGEVLPSRKARNVRNISKEEQRRKHEEQHYIAMSFIEHGVNFHFLTRKYPSMPPKQYRCYIEAINNTVVN